MKSLLFSPAAETDLADIWHYSAEQWGVDQAEHYIDAIRDACHALATGTGQGRRSDVRPDYLKYLVGRHLLYFKENDGCLEIIRILHARMEVSRHL